MVTKVHGSNSEVKENLLAKGCEEKIPPSVASKEAIDQSYPFDLSAFNDPSTPSSNFATGARKL